MKTPTSQEEFNNIMKRELGGSLANILKAAIYIRLKSYVSEIDKEQIMQLKNHPEIIRFLIDVISQEEVVTRQDGSPGRSPSIFYENVGTCDAMFLLGELKETSAIDNLIKILGWDSPMDSRYAREALEKIRKL